MEPKALILCDPEADYVQQMASFLEKDHDFPWEILICTGHSELEKVLQHRTVDVLVLAESLAGEALPRYPVKQIVLLNESGYVRFSELKNIDKYREADHMRKELLGLFAKQKCPGYPVLGTGKRTACVGFYSPVRRCLQTGTAITYGQLQAENSRVLYLNFECYAHFPEVAEIGLDITSLLYHTTAEKEEFALHVRMVRREMGNWHYIPPMRNGEDLPCIEAADWLKLIEKCREISEYDMIILDLSDGMQGLFEVLSLCDTVYMIVKEDGMAREKLARCESLLAIKNHGEILQKTVRLHLPTFARLSARLEDYSRGELADYVRSKLIMEEGNGICGVETVSAE